MPTITECIDNIIEARIDSKKKLEIASETLENFLVAVKNFEQLQKEVESNPAYGQLFTPEILEHIESISTEVFHFAEQKYEKSLEHLKRRFSRENLHISFIGRAGQGKSLVMQNISGLSGNVIPSAEGSDCTGAESIITNDPTATTTKARIEFSSKKEMIEIVNTYLAKIFYGIYKVGSIDEIKNLPLGNMKNQLAFTQVKENELLAQLEKYVLHIEEFETALGTTREVAEQDIEKYVAQFKSGDHSQKYFTYLGVKLANIICKFPEEDAGKIVLVDTIGIGATSLGTEDKMLKTVENDSDAIVFMFRPDAFRPRLSKDEIDIIDEVSKRISPEYAKEMFFWVLNRVTFGKGENAKYMPDLKAQIANRKFPVAMVLEVDCMSPETVKSELLMPILKQLSQRIGNVDELLINRLNELGEKLYKEYRAIADALDKISVEVANEDIRRKLSKEIEDTYRTKVLNALRDLKGLDNPQQKWENSCKPSLRYIREAIPTKATICSLLNDGTIKPFNVLDFCTESMRVRIISRFLKLDTELKDLINQTKMEIIHILADNDKGLLGKIYPIDDQTPEEWIDGFMGKIQCNEKYPLLADALISLKNFTINVQGFLIYKIYRSLDNINISSNSEMPKIFAGLNKKDETDEKTSTDTNKKDELAEEILNLLKDYANQIHNKINKIMSESYSVPNETIFAAIKTFYDQATYAGRDETLSVTTQWRYLYEDWISVIWSEECNAHSLLKGLAQKWNKMVAQLKEYNKEETFKVR